MAAPSTHDFGFDINLARANLVNWLVQARVVNEKRINAWAKKWRYPVDAGASRAALGERGESRERIQQLTSHREATINARAKASDEEVAWSIALNVAQVHANAHGLPAVVRERHMPMFRCSHFPCKKAGVSFALLELVEAQRARGAPEVTIGEDLAALAKRLHFSDPLVKRLEDALRRDQQRYEDMAQDFDRDTWRDLPWSRCIDLISQAKQLARAVEAASLTAREHVLSPELRGRPQGTRGAKKRVLLAAVWKHLSLMGFSRREVSELVPDNNPIRNPNACINRVRKLTESRDWRTFVPWVPDTPGDDPRHDV